MSQSSYSSAPVRISAGTCFKAGFVGALGVFCFGLIATVVLGLISLILGLVFGASLLQILGQS